MFGEMEYFLAAVCKALVLSLPKAPYITPNINPLRNQTGPGCLGCGVHISSKLLDNSCTCPPPGNKMAIRVGLLCTGVRCFSVRGACGALIIGFGLQGVNGEMFRV